MLGDRRHRFDSLADDFRALLGVLVGLAFLNTLGTDETIAVIAMMTILLGFGGTLWIAGKRVQMREAREMGVSPNPVQ